MRMWKFYRNVTSLAAFECRKDFETDAAFFIWQLTIIVVRLLFANLIFSGDWLAIKEPRNIWHWFTFDLAPNGHILSLLRRHQCDIFRKTYFLYKKYIEKVLKIYKSMSKPQAFAINRPINHLIPPKPILLPSFLIRKKNENNSQPQNIWYVIDKEYPGNNRFEKFIFF